MRQAAILRVSNQQEPSASEQPEAWSTVRRSTRTGRTRTIAESQGNGDFSFSDSQPISDRREPHCVEMKRRAFGASRVGFEAPPILKTKQLVEHIALTFCNNRTFRKGLTHELTRQEVRPVPNLSLGTMSTCQSGF